MKTEINVYIAGEEYNYSTEDEAGSGGDLKDYATADPATIIITLKDGSTDTFVNCSYSIFKKKENLVYSFNK